MEYLSYYVIRTILHSILKMTLNEHWTAKYLDGIFHSSDLLEGKYQKT